MKKILYIGNKLSKHGNTPTSIETLGVFIENEGYKMYYSSDKLNIYHRFIKMLNDVIKYRNDVDYIIIDTYSTKNFWYAIATSQLASIFKIKYIPILRGGEFDLRLKNSPFFSKLLLNNSYKNIVPSNFLLYKLDPYQIKNLKYIPNTIEIKNYPFFINREYKSPKLLWVRSFASIYNVKMAIDVLKKLKSNYPDAELCMVGPEKDGSLEQCKAYAKELDLEVKFTGKLSKEEWIKLSENYNIFINTTNVDNTPVSVIEAMSLGLPVVSTNVGGIPYLIKHNKNGKLVEPNDSDAMVKEIISLLENHVQKDEIINNARNLTESFDWEVVKKQWKEILS